MNSRDDGRQGPGVSRRKFFETAAAAGVAGAAATSASAAQPAAATRSTGTGQSPGATGACGAPAGFVQQSAPLAIRRVVTGRNAQGKSTVIIDESIPKITSARPGHQDALIWASPLPADNNDATDGAKRPDPNQSVFRITRYDPGVAPRNHATQTIDYAIVLAGQIDMELETGTVKLKQGDVLVQRGTVHNWVNRGTEPCVVAFILLEARN